MVSHDFFPSFGFGCVCEGEGLDRKCQDAGGKDDIEGDQEYDVI
jgi:hypothetical protein